ncbi:restriction endonuclease [Streptomyces sp. NPDC050085]|uniref:restriction endonuclease n=1 Tax=Streptomyces sp. NPDC050085 TaxID=3365600 RepID=UPI0037902248
MTDAHALRAAAPVYQDETLNEMLERRAADADDAVLEAAVRWATEDLLLAHVLLQLRAHCDDLKRKHTDAHRRATHEPGFDDPACTPTTVRCALAAQRLERLLDQELRWSREDVAHGEQLQQRLRWLSTKPAERYRQYPCSTPELDAAAELLHHCSESSGRVQALLADDRECLHALAIEEQRARDFLASPASTQLPQIHAMSHRRFEHLVSALAARDGLDVERRHGGPHDGGVDVIATTPAGLRVVVQCKHTTTAKPVGVSAVRELMGIGPVHNADISILITNSTFSKHAEGLARQQDIVLFSWWVLMRWATWGESLLDILDLDEVREPAAQACRPHDGESPPIGRHQRGMPRSEFSQ